MMRMSLAVFLFIAAGVSAAPGIAGSEGADGTVKKTRVVLIGASIGQAWELSDFAHRAHDDSVVVESIAAWQYDKSDALDELLMRPNRKPKLTLSYLKGFFQPDPQPADVIILKECSSYFPGDLKRYKASMIDWIQRAQSAGKGVMVATVVPVTRKRAEMDKGKMEVIREYNDWIRAYARQEKLALLDLESALRDNDKERFLRGDLTIGDGSHLNKKAYDILDKLLERELSQMRARTEASEPSPKG